ncbi:MAG TPA: hypothetical protein VE779_05020 [Candidatus Angelobacter sp.]|nr:hypothetical protein [Candidatus Angelobacter sp.]
MAQSGGKWRQLGEGVLFVLLSLCVLAGVSAAQCPVSDPDDDLPPPLATVSSSTRSGEPRIPESGYLSDTTYTSTYFGFVIDLPIALEGHRLMLPLMPPGQHALLAIGFQDGRRSGTMLITASEPPNPVHEMTEDERKAEFLAWAKGQPTYNIAPPDSLTRTGRFYHISKHAGDVTTVQYWTFIKNYLIRVKVASNDAAFLRNAKDAVSGLKFYCAQEDGTLIDEAGKIVPTFGEGYQGPTVPTSVVDAALAERPALEYIQRGEIIAGKYRNEEIGLTYTYPTTWEAEHDDPVLPPKDEIAQRTREALDACSLLLLRLSPAKGDGMQSAGRAITLRAVDQTCLALPAPVSATDTYGAEALGAYLQMLGAFGEVRSHSLAPHGDQLFAEYAGVIGEHADGEKLGQRSAEAMAVTRHRKLLLVWTWTAPTPADLASMPKTAVTFEDAVPIDLVPAAMLAKR